MKADRPSFTAAWVAACRGLGLYLPEEAQLARDPYGLRLAGVLGRVLEGRAATHVPALLRWILYMQVRTRVIDDALLEFVRRGGRQVVLLGAGFDCRAARFASELPDALFYEVDHPATQARKRAVMGDRERVTYIPWDFEHQPIAGLLPVIAARGHDRAHPTLTIWEAVSMYLTEPAIEATVAAVRALSSAGSPFAFTYFDRRALERPRAEHRLLSAFVRRIGEPFRFGWDPAALPAWLRARGFRYPLHGPRTSGLRA